MKVIEFFFDLFIYVVFMQVLLRALSIYK